MRRRVSRQEMPASIRMLVPELARTAVLPREPEASTVMRTMKRRIVENAVDKRVIFVLRTLGTDVALVLVESPSAFLSQPPRIDHFDQQRAGSILRVSQPVVHDAHNVEADIESNEVGQSERSHGVSHSELEYLIDCL